MNTLTPTTTTPGRSSSPEAAASLPSLRLLVLSQHFYPDLSATGQVLTLLCTELARLGIDIEVLCAPSTLPDPAIDERQVREHQGITIHRLWGTTLPKRLIWTRVINQATYTLSVLWRLLADRSKRSLLVVSNPPWLANLCALLRPLGGNPYIYLIHDIWPDTGIRLGKIRAGSLLARAWDFFNRLDYDRASAIVVIGRCMKDLVDRKTGGRTSTKTHIIHVCGDDQAIAPVPRDQNPCISEWGLEGRFVVSYMGNMGRFHDMETIMEAVRLLGDREDMAFVIAGDGHKKDWVRQFAAAHSLTNCQFHSYIDAARYPFALACAHLGLVSLSAGQEGLSVPSKSFAFMAAGIPLVAVMPRACEIARIVEEEECGVVVAPGDAAGLAAALAELREHGERREAMGVRARRAIDSRYNMKEAARAYDELLRSL